MKNEVFSTMERKTRYFLSATTNYITTTFRLLELRFLLYYPTQLLFQLSNEFTNRKRKKNQHCIKSIPFTFSIWSVKELKWKRLGHKIACIFCFMRKKTVMMNNYDGKKEVFVALTTYSKANDCQRSTGMKRMGCGFVRNKHHIA